MILMCINPSMNFRSDDDESPMESEEGCDDYKSTDRNAVTAQAGKAAPEGKQPPKILSASISSPMKKRPWRKPKDMPKRPLSAYNLFFADERKKLLAASEESAELTRVTQDIFSNTSPSPKPQGKKLGFAGLARTVAAKWKGLDAAAKSDYEKQADVEKARYKAQMKEYNEQRLRAQQQASMASGTDPASLRASWPAMPQTIASLGNIYDTSAEQATQQQRTSLDFAHAASSSLGDASSSGLVLPKGQYYGGPQDVFAPMPALDSNRPARRGDFDVSQRRSWAAAPTAAAPMVNWNDERGLAKRLSSPGNISILAEELGQDQVDFFLNSLKDKDSDDEKEKGRDNSK